MEEINENGVLSIYKDSLMYTGDINFKKINLSKIEETKGELKDLILRLEAFKGREKEIKSLEIIMDKAEEKLRLIDQIDFTSFKNKFRCNILEFPNGGDELDYFDISTLEKMDQLSQSVRDIIDDQSKQTGIVTHCKSEIEQLKQMVKPTAQRFYAKTNKLLRYMGITPPKRYRFRITGTQLKSYLKPLTDIVNHYDQNKELITERTVDTVNTVKGFKKNVEGLLGKYGKGDLATSDDEQVVEFMTYLIQADRITESGVDHAYQESNVKKAALKLKERAHKHLVQNGIGDKGVVGLFYAQKFNENLAISIMKVADMVLQYHQRMTPEQNRSF